MDKPTSTASTGAEEGEVTPTRVDDMDVEDPKVHVATPLPFTEGSDMEADILHGGGPRRVRARKELSDQMFKGKWRIDSRLGAPVCDLAKWALEAPPGENAVPDWEVCQTCKKYLLHAMHDYRQDDRSLRAAIYGRDMDIVDFKCPTEVAHLRGELEATERMLAHARQEVQELTKHCMALTAKCARAEMEEDRLYKDRNRALEELGNWIRGVSAPPPVDRLAAMKGDVPRKRAAPSTFAPTTGNSGDRAGPSSQTQPTQPPDTNNDVVMGNAVVEKQVTDWRKLPKLPAMVLSYKPAGTVQIRPPQAGTWPFEGGKFGVFRSISDYDAAMDFAEMSRCWAVGLATSRPFYEGFVKSKDSEEPDLTPLQRHALDWYRMPVWFAEILKKYFADTDLVAENKRFWAGATRTAPDDSDRAAASYWQRIGVAPEGCPFIDDFHTLDGRLFRGFRRWNAITDLPARDASIVDLAAGSPNLALAQPLLLALLVPGSYRRDLQTYDITVASEEKLTLWPAKTREPNDLSDGALTTRLAGMGLTPEAVDDMFPYLHSIAMDIVAEPRTGWDVDLIRSALNGCTAAVRHPPKGEEREYGQYIFRPPGLLWPEKYMNNVQERLLFVPGIPLYPAPGSSEVKTFTFKPTTATPSNRGTSHPRARGTPFRGAPRGGRDRGRGFAPPQGFAPPPVAGPDPNMQAAMAASAFATPLPNFGSPQAGVPPGYLANSANFQTTPSTSAFWPSASPAVALPPAGPSSTPASQAMRQQYSTNELFAQPDAGTTYYSSTGPASTSQRGFSFGDLGGY
ncbi:hypothetical protein MSAN_01836500 [Mycena sanguinolenta]|uniref:Uncharacterized protein n=1 Tax=Mycena sanguinolenta TaxID=230812 RepID=A0A8H6XTN3_9AGAR|nr:hypothetical protein MSAN_01836500 [Mycena sanguinolenta]